MASRVKPVRSTTLLDKYRSVIVATAFIILSIPAFSQSRQPVRARGFDWEEGKFKRALIPPPDTLQLTLKDTGAIVYKGTPPRAYIWSNHSGVLRWDTTAGSGGGSGEIVIPSFGIDKIGTVIKVDTAEISTFRALRDTAASIRSSAIGEVLTTQFGISKTGTTLKADTSQISTVRALQDTANNLRKLRSTLLARRSVQAVNDTTFQLVGDTTVNPNSGQKSLYGFNTDGSRGFIPVKEYDISTTIGELRAKAASATGAMIYRFQSADDVSDFRYDPSDNSSADDSVMVIVNGGRRLKRHYTVIDPYWFGFVPNTGQDMTPYLQKAVNFARDNGKTSLIRITHAGQYIVNDLLILKYGSGQSQQVGLTIEGIAPSNGVNYIEFKTNNPNSAGIHIVQSKGVVIRYISFTGPSQSVPDVVNGDYTIGGTIRSNYLTPNAAITIDEFYTGAGTTFSGSGNYRPTVPASMYANTHYGGSSGVLIEQCNISKFYVGIANGLSGAPNGENVIFRSNLLSSDIAYFWVAGQLQSRENIIDGLWFYGGLCFITNVGFGTGQGDLPVVQNYNVNNIKYMFQAHGDFTTVRFMNGYSEAVWSLGKSTSQNAVNFKNVNYTHTGVEVIGGLAVKPSPVWVECNSIIWEGGKIEMPDYNGGMQLSVQQALFTGTFLRSTAPFITRTDIYDRINFKNCVFTGDGGTQGRTLNEDERVLTAATQNGLDVSTYNHRYFLPGATFSTRDNRTFTNVGQKIDRLPVGAYAITLNTANATATFTPDNTGRFKLNDLITIEENVDYGGDIYSAASTSLGYVTGISGGVVTVSNVPGGIANSATYTMNINRVPVFIGRVIGTLTANSNVITNVISENASATFDVGDRVKGEGIPAGAYVQSVNSGAGTITLSVNVSANVAVAELYDVKTKVTANNNTFNFFSSLVNVQQLGFVWWPGDEIMNVTGGDVRSWYCTAAGQAGNGTAPPSFITSGNDPDVVRKGAANPMTSSANIRFPANATNSAISVGGLNLQSYVADDGWMGMNVFEDATGWHRWEYGTGGALRISYGTLYFHNTVDGAPGTNVTAPMVERFSVNPSGIMKVPSLATGGASQMVVANASGQFGIQAIPSSTNLYNSNGTMTGSRQISGANFDIALGLTSSKFNSISLYSGGKINLYGLVAKGSVPITADVDRTLPGDVTNVELKATLTANRSLTLPDPSTLGMGSEMYIINVLDNTPFNWSFSTTVIDNKTGSTVTQIDHRAVYHLYVDASLQWRIIDKY